MEEIFIETTELFFPFSFDKAYNPPKLILVVQQLKCGRVLVEPAYRKRIIIIIFIFIFI